MLNQYFEQLREKYPNDSEINRSYFESLLNKFYSNQSVDLIIDDGVNDSGVIPYALLKNKELVPVVHYENLPPANPINSALTVLKMHAGLGSSVHRLEYLKEKSGRTELGSKGTDLFIGEESIAKLQLKQVKILRDSGQVKKTRLINLVNEETERLVKQELPECEVITQLKMPTIDERGEISTERKAPGGHAFLGYQQLLDIFEHPSTEPEVIAIGNGEDLNSTPDLKIISWMESNQIPICMITTTKTPADKKGGQIAYVMDDTPYLTIIEKAQAEKAGQREFFEAIGLRDGDGISLFNTNIVLINRHIMGSILGRIGSKEVIKKIITPDLIKNEKPQEGKVFTQLEGAIASVMLNLDKYAREHYGHGLITFLNLDPESREHFFIPIKKMSDFNSILKRYDYDESSGRLVLR